MKPIPANRQRLLVGFLIVLPIVCILGVVLSFARMFQRDMRALTDFMTSYAAYDQAMAEYATPVFEAAESAPDTSAQERRTADALSDLASKSTAQISSLTKNEKEAMRVMREITALSTKEMDTLNAYRRAAGQDADRTLLAQSFHDLTEQRQAAFAHFRQLGR